jgi:hypothetical protein
MRRTLTKAGQKVALAFRWLIIGALSAAFLVPFALVVSSEV